jgi:hypothetical protein
MKRIFKIVGILAGLVLLAFIYWMIQLGNAFGWKPESTELKLSEKEIVWKSLVEKKYDCNFNFIGLNQNYMEDSVIYMDIIVYRNSPFQNQIIDSLSSFATKLSKSFFYKSERRKNQSCIRITFNNIFLKQSSNKVTKASSKIFLYNFKTLKTTEFIY